MADRADDLEPLLLDAKQVAGLLRISSRLVWGMRSGGRLPAPVRLGKATRWRASDIRRWVEEGCPASNDRGG
jgi:predicted DNA-binding transcriptional regulator AlpA